MEVNTLSSDHGPLRWQPLFHSLIPVSLHCIQVSYDPNFQYLANLLNVKSWFQLCFTPTPALQEGSVYVYRVSGSGVTGTSFSVDIKVPGKCVQRWKTS